MYTGGLLVNQRQGVRDLLSSLPLHPHQPCDWIAIMKQLDKCQRIAALLILALLLAGFGPTHPAYAATINVTTFADNPATPGDCSLREAIEAANTDTAIDACPAGSGADTI